VVEGVIVDFDVQRGDGHLRSADGHQYYFHCVNIADGTRLIRVGASARARRGVGRLGHDEVVDVREVAQPTT
jgi:hypothetical protein